MNLVPIVIAFGEEPVIFQLGDAVAEGAVLAEDGRMVHPGFEEPVLAQHGLEFGDRGATVDDWNTVPKECEAVPDELVHGLRILACGVQIDDNALGELDRLGAAQHDVAHGLTVALGHEAPVVRLRAIDESPVQELRVSREDHGVVPARSLPELVDVGAEAVNLDDAGGSWPAQRTLQ